MAQKVYFDPTKAFDKRLFGNQAQQANGQNQKKQLQQPDYVLRAKEKADAIKDGNDLIKHSIKRVRKKINDYILINYQKLFFKNDLKELGANLKTLSSETILTNAELLSKVEAELRLSDDQDKLPRDLLNECIVELEENGFLSCLETK